MPSFTRQAIIASFMKIADEKPISKISVRDIVDDCGVNRNTFYYHFEDIPTLVETILKQEADALLKQCESIGSVEECIEVATKYAAGKKKALMNLYNSVNRDIYERYLMEICEYAVRGWFKKAYDPQDLKDELREILVQAYKCELFGFVIDWLNHSMNEKILNGFLFVCEARNGEIERIIEAAKARG